jgi:hypothetical protein
MADTVADATGLVRSERPGQLSDGINDWPLMQFYPDSGGQDPGGQTDRTTFGGGVRQTEVIVLGDLYAKQRTEIGEDMAALLPIIDAVVLVLEAQDSQPFFGVAGIQQFKWSWRRVIFEYGDKGATKYIGARFTFTLRLY